MQDRIRTSFLKVRKLELFFASIRNVFISVKIHLHQQILTQFCATIIVLQNINLFKLSLFEVRGSQKICNTVPMNVSD